MAELKRRADLRRKRVQECVEERKILLEIRRKLKQQGAELWPERRCRLQELLHALAAIAQTCVVRDAFGCFERELEGMWRRLAPAIQNLLVRSTVKGVVDLDGRKSLRVVRKHLGGRQLLRIEAAPPFRIVVTGRSDPGRHQRKCKGQSGKGKVTSATVYEWFVHPSSCSSA